jgi:hypothetical protein
MEILDEDFSRYEDMNQDKDISMSTAEETQSAPCKTEAEKSNKNIKEEKFDHSFSSVEFEESFLPEANVEFKESFSRDLPPVEPEENFYTKVPTVEYGATVEVRKSNFSNKLRNYIIVSSIANAKNELLSSFYSKKGIYPKKEYLRARLIRGHKRALREAKSGLMAKHTINKLVCAHQKLFWRKFLKFFDTHWIDLDDISKTDNDPIKNTNKNKKLNRTAGTNNVLLITKNDYKSFSNSFCINYFSNPVIIESFNLYLDYVFAATDPKSLSERFGFSCCPKNQGDHFLCSEKWENLEKYIRIGLFGLPAVDSLNTFIEESSFDAVNN